MIFVLSDSISSGTELRKGLQVSNTSLPSAVKFTGLVERSTNVVFKAFSKATSFLEATDWDTPKF